MPSVGRLVLVLLLLLQLVAPARSDGLKHMRSHGKDKKRHKNDPTEDSALSTVVPILTPHLMPPPLIDAMPLFVKFHKCGSGTAANVFRRHCPEAAARDGLRGIFPWRGGPSCGPLPHEHASIGLYRTKGVPGFQRCVFNRTGVQLYTVLRDPVER